MTADRPVPPAPCLTRRDWKYETADSHCDASEFRKRQHERLMDAQPHLRAVQEQERRAA